MNSFFQFLINGLVVGSTYALVALGYTMVYGILGLINFAHGEVLMLGTLSALQTILTLSTTHPDWPPLLLLAAGLGVAILVCMFMGYAMERFTYRRLRNAPRLAPLIAAIGLSFLLQTLAMIIWGRGNFPFPQLISVAPIELTDNVTITTIQIVIIVTSAVLMGGLIWVVNHTRLGRAMRATAENHRVANLMGVDTNRIISATFVLGAALAAVAGVMLASNYGTASYSMGFMPGLKAFTAAVLGGIGNLAGAVVGGLVLGLIEALGTGYIEQISFGFLNSSYQDIFAFVILGIVLIFRPTGLLGERVADRA